MDVRDISDDAGGTGPMMESGAWIMAYCPESDRVIIGFRFPDGNRLPVATFATAKEFEEAMHAWTEIWTEGIVPKCEKDGITVGRAGERRWESKWDSLFGGVSS